MLYCMALTLNELETLNYKINLKLKEDGINIYTVRNTLDGDFQKGSHIGEDLYEMNGFIVHFFSDEKVKKLLNGYRNLEIIRFEGKASTSFLQRKLQIGYNRAARIIDMMEADGVVSKANHVGKRDVL